MELQGTIRMIGKTETFAGGFQKKNWYCLQMNNIHSLSA